MAKRLYPIESMFLRWEFFSNLQNSCEKYTFSQLSAGESAEHPKQVSRFIIFSYSGVKIVPRLNYIYISPFKGIT